MTLTLQEAADRLGVHYMTVYRWVRTGRLPATKVGAGWSVDEADLAALDGTSSTSGTRPPGRSRVDHADRLAKRLVAGDEAGAMAVAEAALAGGMEPEDLYLDVLAGAMTRIGDRWGTGEVSIAEEHQATALMLRLLGRLGRSFSRRGRRRGTIVLGAVAGDHHGLPGAILADPLRGRGFTVVDLGADTPAQAFVDAARASEGLTAVGLTLTSPPLDPLAEAVAALRDADLAARIVVGGAAVTGASAAEAVGADGWAPDGRAALEALVGDTRGS